MRDRLVERRAVVGRQRPPARDRRVPGRALRARGGGRGGTRRSCRPGRSGPARAPPSMLMLQMVIRCSMVRRADGLAAVLEDVAGPAADPDPGDQREDDVLGADARAPAGRRRGPRRSSGRAGAASGSRGPSRPRSSRSRTRARRTRRGCAVCESPHTIVIPGWVRPSCGPMTWTMPWLGAPMPWSGMPNSAQLASSWLTWAAAIASRIGRLRGVVGIEWSAVATVWLGPPDARARAARSPVNACGLVTSWTRWRSTARTAGRARVLGDDVVVPDLRRRWCAVRSCGAWFSRAWAGRLFRRADSVPAGPGRACGRSVPRCRTRWSYAFGTTRVCHFRAPPDITNVPLLGGHCPSATHRGVRTRSSANRRTFGSSVFACSSRSSRCSRSRS